MADAKPSAEAVELTNRIAQHLRACDGWSDIRSTIDDALTAANERGRREIFDLFRSLTNPQPLTAEDWERVAEFFEEASYAE